MVTDNTPKYSHGQPFDRCLGENIKLLIDRINNNKASLIILDGGVGEGKTTLLVEILDYINFVNGKDPIMIQDEKGNAGPQMAMGGVDFLKKLRICFNQKLPCIGYDEAGDFTKRGSLSKFNAMLNRTFETFRAFKILVVLSLPNFDVLDNQLFDNQIPRMLIHLKNRSAKQGNFAVYDLEGMNWVRFWMGKWPKHKQKAYGRTIPNFYGHFLNISEQRSKQLDRISTKNKLEILKHSEIKIEGLLSYVELAQKLDMSLEWVRKSIARLKIKEKKTYKQRKYFDPEVANQLADLLESTSEKGKK